MVQNLPLDSLASTASSFASVHGILVERRQTDLVSATSTDDDDDDDENNNNNQQQHERQQSYFECAPISLLPNAFPKASFQQAVKVSPLFNRLVDKLSTSEAFLQDTLAQVVQADPFTAQLLQLYQEIYVQPETETTKWARQADRLGLFRSDYMLHTNNQIKQVELNTIASSFGALSARVAALHRHLTHATYAHNDAVTAFLEQNKLDVLKNNEDGTPPPSTTDSGNDFADGVPENPALEKLAKALHVAAQHYQERFMSNDNDKPIVLFVVQPGETNTVDQRLLEFQLTQAHGWRVVRQSLSELAEAAEVDPETGALSITLAADNERKHLYKEQVAVVYYRAGYAPKDYFGDAEWQARKTLECSRATKSPCLGYHLAGTKKVQQALARPGALETILGDSATALEIEQLQRVFAGLYSLGEDMTEEDKQAVTSILVAQQQSKYVLKPQREGGGYNFYGSQMVDRLKPHVTIENDQVASVDHSVLGEFILMERLFPPEQRAILLRGGQVEGSGPSISELGCFGTVLCGPDGSVLHNEYAGFLMRTKFSHVDEGGVAAGYATLSSPYLV
eukprot:CAMPEP_0168733188 /NCGR_PEP_ID=MMETSP0724-20121128/8159_1 /TAXON_ID=265536 /ORGANISM="Amphiprora sp., Strain CCMP467" /LENGTH=565 /DNA_ID=CAMNT_0008780233 /DNA_START=397 /DNA_END=2094 /DNA_ORIENTATION=+